MTIKDFDEKVRIGDWVSCHKKIYKIVDIDRRNHTVIVKSKNNNEIRCSEIKWLGKELKGKI